MGEQVGNATFEHSLDLNLKFECDISVSGNCDSPLSTYEGEVEDELKVLKDQAGEKEKKYNDAKDRCDKAKEKIQEKEKDLADRNTDYEDHRVERAEKHGSRSKDMCRFGDDYQ